MQTYSPVSVLTGHAAGLTEPRRIGCEHDESASTRGHLADHGGLRGHSVGDVYPWRVVGYGDGSWAVESCKGETVARCYSNDACKRAHAMARSFKVLHPLGRVEDDDNGNPCNVSGPLDEIAERLEGYLLVLHTPASGYSDRVRVCNGTRRSTDQGGYPAIRVLNHGTGMVSLVSTRWLARARYLSVSIPVSEFADFG